MNVCFGFFLRLLLAFVAAKLFLRVLAAESLNWLILLTLIFLVNAYLFEYPQVFDFLRRRPRSSGGAGPPPGTDERSPAGPPAAD